MELHDWLAELDGPTAAELAAIEAEEPLIRAEITLVDAEARVLTTGSEPSELDWRRLRRAEARVGRLATELAARPVARQAVA